MKPTVMSVTQRFPAVFVASPDQLQGATPPFQRMVRPFVPADASGETSKNGTKSAERSPPRILRPNYFAGTKPVLARC
jgi:hypothetical protein